MLLLLVIGRGSSQQRRASLQSERLLGRSEAILERVADGVVVTDAGGNVLEANPAARRIMEYSGPVGPGRHCSEVLALGMGQRRLDCSQGCALLGLAHHEDGDAGHEVTAIDLKRHWRALGFSHFGAAWMAMAFTCGPHHLEHGLHLAFSGRDAGGVELLTVLVGLPAGGVWFLLRVEALAGGRGDRFISGTPGWLATIPKLAAAYVGAFVGLGLGLLVRGTHFRPTMIPNILLVWLYMPDRVAPAADTAAESTGAGRLVRLRGLTDRRLPDVRHHARRLVDLCRYRHLRRRRSRPRHRLTQRPRLGLLPVGRPVVAAGDRIRLEPARTLDRRAGTGRRLTRRRRAQPPARGSEERPFPFDS